MPDRVARFALQVQPSEQLVVEAQSVAHEAIAAGSNIVYDAGSLALATL